MTPADALTIALHAVAREHTIVERDRDPALDEEERARQLDELDQARDELRKLRAHYFATPIFKRATDGDDSTDPTATTPPADAGCAEPAVSTA